VRSWRLAPLAKADLGEIWSYIAGKGSTAAADRLINKIEVHCDMLGRMPKAGRDASDLWPGARAFPVGNYIILLSREASEWGLDISCPARGARRAIGLLGEAGG
jgi:toxin ParE1/3/4